MTFALLLAVSLSGDRVLTALDQASQLGLEMGKPVLVEKKLQREQVYLSRHGCSSSVALIALAKALHASVTSTESGFRIARSPDDLKALHATRIGVRTQWISRRFAAVDGFRERSFRGQSPADANKQALGNDSAPYKGTNPKPLARPVQFTSSSLLPANALLQKLATQIGISHLAAIESGTAVEYEDSPVGGDFALPDHHDLDLEYREAMNKLGDYSRMGDVSLDLAFSFHKAEYEAWEKRLGDPRKLRLWVSADLDGLAFRLEGFDANGKRVLLSWQGVRNKDTIENTNQMASRIASLGVSNPMVELRPASVEALEIAHETGPYPQWFLHPEQNEPLDLFVRDALAAEAEKHPSQCFAVCVDDGFWGIVRYSLKDKKIDMNMFEAFLDQTLPYETNSDKKMLVWRPVDPEYSESSRADRKELSRFATAYRTGALPDLRKVSLLVKRASQFTSSLTHFWDSTVADRMHYAPVIDTFLPGEVLRIMGACNDEGWDQLATGYSVSAEKLGVVPEVERLFRSRNAMAVNGNSTFPDIFQNPRELYPSGDLGQTGVTIGTQAVAKMNAWDEKKAEPEGMSWADQTRAGIFYIPFFWLNGKMECRRCS